MVVHPGHAGCCAGFGDGVVDFLDREPRAVALHYPAQVIPRAFARCRRRDARRRRRSEEHTSELQSLMRISYAVFCLKKKIKKNHIKRAEHIITHRHMISNSKDHTK